MKNISDKRIIHKHKMAMFRLRLQYKIIMLLVGKRTVIINATIDKGVIEIQSNLPAIIYNTCVTGFN